MTLPSRSLVASLALTALAACSGAPSRPKSAPPPVVAVSTGGEIDAAFVLLMAGKEDVANKQLKKLLKRDPMSADARLLSDSIERDPNELLGPHSYTYTVRAGDTIDGLAKRLLGNRFKAYQFIRYNGLKAPVALVPGQTLKIPGEPPRLEPVRRPEPVAPHPPTGGSAKPKPAAAKPAAARPTKSATPATPATNPAAARAARASGLSALNAGDISRAVGLLRRAASLDPGNPAIGYDVARAERIAATVRARR